MITQDLEGSSIAQANPVNADTLGNVYTADNLTEILNTKVNESDILSYEEISATTDLSSKIVNAEAIKKISSVFAPVISNNSNYYGYQETKNENHIIRNQLDSDGVFRKLESSDNGANWSNDAYALKSEVDSVNESLTNIKELSVAMVVTPIRLDYVKLYQVGRICTFTLWNVNVGVVSNTDTHIANLAVVPTFMTKWTGSCLDGSICHGHIDTNGRVWVHQATGLMYVTCAFTTSG